MNVLMTNSTTSAMHDSTASNAACATPLNGNTSRGHGTLLMSEMLPTMLVEALLIEFEKNVHGISATYENNEYGTSELARLRFWKTTVNATMSTSGVRIDQANPRTACLYRDRMARSARLRVISRALHASRTARTTETRLR